ncbi:hypothetical protein J437_LFUL003126 [Ladona fulva]|uniref:Peptidase S1 domain-containing protein n=1 Tax=Ladona fulva TaxID=123851 RepID=A0A8K0PBQ0_LADFU|nr:hypothetical protein J437_LFUL003126 [Ladona fulva]
MELSLRYFVYKCEGFLKKTAAARYISTMLRFFIFSCLVVCAFGGVTNLRRPRFDGRIVGGEGARIEDYPHQLSLLHNGFHLCGASVISENFAMTAAHCTDGRYVSDMKVRAGSDQINSGGTVHDIEEVIQNEKYSNQQLDYDISLLRVSQPFVYSSTVQPIGLPPPAGPGEDIPDNSAVDVSGWGSTYEGGALPEQLQHVIVHTVNMAECEKSYGRLSDVYEKTLNLTCPICLIITTFAFQGDSGGPLISGGIQYGIVSFGYGCATAGYPGVYARVAAFRDWIKQHSGL